VSICTLQVSTTTLNISLDFNLVNNALLQAAESFGDVNENEVSIMAPCFLIDVDRAGAASDRSILFGQTTWASGHRSAAPDFADPISSFEVIDRLLAHYTNTDIYPNLKVCIFNWASCNVPDMISRP
jgi:hypothetical protein